MLCFPTKVNHSLIVAVSLNVPNYYIKLFRVSTLTLTKHSQVLLFQTHSQQLGFYLCPNMWKVLTKHHFEQEAPTITVLLSMINQTVLQSRTWFEWRLSQETQL